MLAKLTDKLEKFLNFISETLGCMNAFFGLGMIILLMLIIIPIVNTNIAKPEITPVYQVVPKYSCEEEPVLIVRSEAGLIAYSDHKTDAEITIFLPQGSVISVIEHRVKFSEHKAGRWFTYDDKADWTKIRIIDEQIELKTGQSEFWIISDDARFWDIHYCSLIK